MGFLQVSTVVDAVGAGAGEPVAAGLADGVTASFVFVTWGDVADGGREPHRVVVALDADEFGVEFGPPAG